jgi:uncharacterized membrane protein YdjX (TVP38/TMEM64 family)
MAHGDTRSLRQLRGGMEAVRSEGVLSPRRWVFLGLLVLAIALLRTVDVDALPAWVRAAGPLGPVLLGTGYVIAAAFALPVAAMSMTAGFVYGVGAGTAMILPAAVCGSAVGFALGRTVLRERVERRLRGDRRFVAIDRAIEGDGFRITLLARMSPLVPFGALNYLLSATSVRPRDYLAASAIGVLPGTLLFVYLGSIAGRAGEGGDLTAAVPWIGAALAIVAAVFIARLARRALTHAREVAP